MNSFPILSSIIILPLFGAFISMLVKGTEKDISKNVRDLALWISIVELGLVALLCYQFEYGSSDFQNIEKKILLSKFGISYFLGVDAGFLLKVTGPGLVIINGRRYTKSELESQVKSNNIFSFVKSD